MVGHSFLSLLNRRGVWMTPVEIFDASPEYPIGDYVNADLQALKANGMIVCRPRRGSRLAEYGLPSWVNAPEPGMTPRYLAYLLSRFIKTVFALSEA